MADVLTWTAFGMRATLDVLGAVLTLALRVLLLALLLGARHR